MFHTPHYHGMSVYEAADRLSVSFRIRTHPGDPWMRLDGSCRIISDRKIRNPEVRSSTGLIQELSNQPHMSEWIDDGALQHSFDRSRSSCRMMMFLDGTTVDGSRRQRLSMHANRIIDE